MAQDPTCVFCRIVSGQIPSARLIETDSAIAFLDINPIAPGHTLLVPREHAATMADASPALISAAAAELPRLTRAILAATGAKGLNIIQNNGREAGQLVDHVHFHLVPRSAEDAIRIHWSQGKYQGTAMEEMRSRIVQNLSGSG